MKKYNTISKRIIAIVLASYIGVISTILPTFNVKSYASEWSLGISGMGLLFEFISSLVKTYEIGSGFTKFFTPEDEHDVETEERYAKYLAGMNILSLDDLRNSAYYKTLDSDKQIALEEKWKELLKEFVNGDVTYSELESAYNDLKDSKVKLGIDSSVLKSPVAITAYKKLYQDTAMNNVIDYRGYNPWPAMGNLYKYYEFVSVDNVIRVKGNTSFVRYKSNGALDRSLNVLYFFDDSEMLNPLCIIYSGKQGDDRYLNASVDYYYAYSFYNNDSHMCSWYFVNNENFYNSSGGSLRCNVFNTSIPMFENRLRFEAWIRHFSNSAIDYDSSWMLNADNFYIDDTHTIEDAITSETIVRDIDNVVPSVVGKGYVTYDDLQKALEKVASKQYVTTNEYATDAHTEITNIDNSTTIINDNTVTFDDTNILTGINSVVDAIKLVVSTSVLIQEKIADIFTKIASFDIAGIVSAVKAIFAILQLELVNIREYVASIPEIKTLISDIFEYYKAIADAKSLADVIAAVLSIPAIISDIFEAVKAVPTWLSDILTAIKALPLTIPDILNDIKAKIEAISITFPEIKILDYFEILGKILTGVLAIPDSLADILTAVQAFFILDTVAVHAYIDENKPSLDYPFFNKFTAVFIPFQTRYKTVTYPKIEITCPDILKPHLKTDTILVYDFATHANWYQKLRIVLSFAIWFGLVWSLVKRFSKFFGT